MTEEDRLRRLLLDYSTGRDRDSARVLVEAYDKYARERFGLSDKMLKRTISVETNSTLGRETEAVLGVSYGFFEMLKIQWGLPMN
jgi:hypothetical protein